MELFRFDPQNANYTDVEGGIAIRDFDSAVWVERYRQAGEFKIKGPLSSGLREALPLDSLVSHIATDEIMVVENHIIVEDKESDPEIEVSGRSFDALLEHRQIGWEEASVTEDRSEVVLAVATTAAQVSSMITSYVISAPQSSLSTMSVDTSLVTHTLTSASRMVNLGDLHKAIIDILTIDDLGLKSRRPTIADPSIQLQVHNGSDKTGTAIFSWDGGDLKRGEYLWSTKRRKNTALIASRYFWKRNFTSPLQNDYWRRMMYIDASELDSHYPEVPTGSDAANIKTLLLERGLEAMAGQTDVTIARVDISENASQVYRRDYNIGDLVTVEGNYNALSTMRVVENIETIDENGASSTPVLSVPQGA